MTDSFNDNYPYYYYENDEAELVEDNCDNEGGVCKDNATDYYDIGHRDDAKKRGRCVILNFEKFIDTKKTRAGTEHDVKSLKDSFEELGFEVIVHRDMTRRGTRFILKNESESDHSQYRCFVLCILSHGEPGRFLCIDSEGIEYEHLFAQFNGENCKTLRGKPKLFFIQACQGDEHDEGTSVLNTDSSQVLAIDSVLRLRPDNPATRPITADLLAFFCSYSNYYSMRDKKKGSWFIQDLTNVLKNFAHREDLFSIIRRVQRKVSEREASQISEDGETSIKQMPRFESTLVKNLKF